MHNFPKDINPKRDLIMPRDIYKYHFKLGNKIVHTGITNDLERREQQHQSTYGETGHIRQVGRKTTKDAALTWENKQAKKGRPTRRG